MIARHLSRALALAALAGCLVLAFGQGEAAAQADATAEIRALQTKVEQLSARVTALDAMFARQGRVITLSGARLDDELILRATPPPSSFMSVGDKDAVLSFRRIHLTGDEITVTGKKTITLKAPAITLDGQIAASRTSDVTVKGFTVRDN